jgi:hypothetical protein
VVVHHKCHHKRLNRQIQALKWLQEHRWPVAQRFTLAQQRCRIAQLVI